MTRSVILGGAGFLGSHLCDFLIERGHEVVVIDDLTSGRVENIEHNIESHAVQFLHQNICLPITIDGNIDFVFNLASPASPPRYMKLQRHTLSTGSLGTMNALDLAGNKGARFIQASTSEVYGDPLEHPQKEIYWGNVNPIGPRSCYDESKRFSEALCIAYANESKIDVGIARIFNTYGPRLNPIDVSSTIKAPFFSFGFGSINSLYSLSISSAKTNLFLRVFVDPLTPFITTETFSLSFNSGFIVNFFK